MGHSDDSKMRPSETPFLTCIETEESDSTCEGTVSTEGSSDADSELAATPEEDETRGKGLAGCHYLVD